MFEFWKLYLGVTDTIRRFRPVKSQENGALFAQRVRACERSVMAARTYRTGSIRRRHQANPIAVSVALTRVSSCIQLSVHWQRRKHIQFGEMRIDRAVAQPETFGSKAMLVHGTAN